jgi:ribonuclease-3
MSTLADLQEAIGFTFKDDSLFREALVHRSYLHENPSFPSRDNQRLEFLGDALLDFVAGDYLYRRYPKMREGELTSLRAALVKEETLARFAQALDLGRYLYLGRGEEESGGRERPSLLADAFEALAGALYLDGGLKAAKRFILRFLEPETDRIIAQGEVRDYKSLFQEEAQRRFQATPLYRTIDERGPDHNKLFTVEVLIEEKVYGRGEGRTKQAAEQEAARQALEKIASDE